MCTKRSLGCAAVAILCLLLCIVAWPVKGQAQCNATTCGAPVGGQGDLNNSGTVDVQDVLLMIKYCTVGGAAPCPLCNMEVNGYCNPWFPCQPTLGDLAQVINIAFAGGTGAACTAAGPLPKGPLTFSPSWTTVPPGTNRTTSISILANNPGPTPKRLFGYTAPITVLGLLGTTVSSVTVTWQYKGPGDIWTPSSVISRSPTRFFAFGVPDNNLTSQLIPAGGAQAILTISVTYSTRPWRPYGLIALWPYTASPSEVPVLSISGEMAGEKNPAATMSEQEFEFQGETAQAPAMSDSGHALLVVLLLVIGILMAGGAWRLKAQRARL